jgi:hypothetical protein
VQSGPQQGGMNFGMVGRNRRSGGGGRGKSANPKVVFINDLLLLLFIF